MTWERQTIECDFCGAEYTGPSPYLADWLAMHNCSKRTLDCLYCEFRGTDFANLAAHVIGEHNPQGYSEEEREKRMLQPPGGGKQASQREGDGQRKRTPPAVPFVKVEDLTQEPKRAKILGVQTQNTGFNDIIVKIAMNARSYFFGLKASNPNYELLFNAFGPDENKWVGEEFTLGLQWNEFYEKNFVQVFEAPAPDAKGAKKK